MLDQVITPYMVSPDKGNLQSKVFFVWGLDLYHLRLLRLLPHLGDQGSHS